MLKEEKIYLRKMYQKTLKESKAEFKPSACLYCNIENPTFCNSHSVPAFILRNIAKEGVVFHSLSLDEVSIFNSDLGIRSAGTFHVICKDCDAKYFKIYEDEVKLLQVPNNYFLEAIRLKSLLRDYYIKGIDVKFFSKILEKLYSDSQYPLSSHSRKKFTEDLKNQIEVHRLDFAESQSKIHSLVSKGEPESYNLLFWKVLDYKIPVACQASICLYGDLRGKIVNDVYNYSSDNIMDEVYVCAFPMNPNSLVIMFYPENNSKIDKFAKQFQEKVLSEQLEIINYMIFLHTEHFFLSPNIKTDILTNNSLRSVKNDLRNIRAYKFRDAQTQNYQDKQENLLKLKRRRPKIPNLLSSRYGLE